MEARGEPQHRTKVKPCNPTVAERATATLSPTFLVIILDSIGGRDY